MFFKTKEKIKEKKPKDKPTGFHWPWPNPLGEYGQQRMNDNLRLLAKDAFIVSLALFLIFSWFEWRNPGNIENIVKPGILFFFSLFSWAIYKINQIKEKAIAQKKKIIAVAQYGFLISLALTTIGSLDFLFIQKITFPANIVNFLKANIFYTAGLAIFFGFFTFWLERDRIKKEVEDDEEKEKLEEEKRENEFPQKYPKINKIPVLRGIIKWGYKEEWIYSLTLFSLIIIGFSLRLLGGLFGNINLDEGIHLYDAKLIVEGLIPFRDYMTREPFYIYLLSIFVKFLGPGLFTSRILSILANTLTIFIIYLLGKKIFSKKIALGASFFFSLSPFLIYENYLGNLYGVYSLIISLTFLALAFFMEKRSLKYLLLAGFLLGASVHFYRLTVFYFPFFTLILSLNIDRNKFIKASLFLLSFSIPFLLPIIYFSYQAGYGNFNIIYGTDQLLTAYLSIPIIFLLSFYYKKIIKNKKTKEKIILLLIMTVLLFFVYSFFNLGLNPKNKSRIIFEIFFQSWHVIFFIFLSFLFYLKNKISNKKLFYLLNFLISTILVLLLNVGLKSSVNLESFGLRIINNDLKVYFILILIISLIIIQSILVKVNIKKIKTDSRLSSWWLLFFAPLFFYLIHVQLFTNNFISYAVIGSILASFGSYLLIEALPTFNNTQKLITILILIQFWFLPAFIYKTVPLKDRAYDQKTINEITTYLKSNTRKEDSIFTNELIPILESNRKSFMNLSRASIYGKSSVYMPNYIGVSENLIPSEELANKMLEECDYILMDRRTSSLFSSNEDFKNIENKYQKIKEWPEISVSLWKRIRNSN